MKKIFCFLLVLSMACRQSYTPPVVTAKNNFLVVEGFLNNGPDSTYINLSRTFSLADTSRILYELHAQLTVEAKDNSASISLPEVGQGRYGRVLSLNPSQSYRLRILTAAGKTYLSDFVPLKTSPPIDSISYGLVRDGLQIYANTHDAQSNSHYYRWDFEQTWQFHSIYYSSYQYNHSARKIEVRTADTFYTCWKGGISTNIILGSTTKLLQDEVSLQPLVLIPMNSWIISVKYSIFVRQYVLTAEAFSFWQEMQKNSEKLGSIFDAQPSENKGNIRCTSDSSERVIGYISAGTVQHQRIYITPDDIPGWNPYPYENCELISIPDNPDSLESFLGGGGFLPVNIDTDPPRRYNIAGNSCVDCTLIGTNKKPSFWP